LVLYVQFKTAKIDLLEIIQFTVSQPEVGIRENQFVAYLEHGAHDAHPETHSQKVDINFPRADELMKTNCTFSLQG
jgi:hypothetical protein